MLNFLIKHKIKVNSTMEGARIVIPSTSLGLHMIMMCVCCGAEGYGRTRHDAGGLYLFQGIRRDRYFSLFLTNRVLEPFWLASSWTRIPSWLLWLQLAWAIMLHVCNWVVNSVRVLARCVEMKLQKLPAAGQASYSCNDILCIYNT